MEDKTLMALVGMCCLTALCVASLLKGIDSTILALTVSAISGIAGYELKAMRTRE